jgi:predicted ATPase/class 3 adenylate cyclase
MAPRTPPVLPTGIVTFLFSDVEGSTRLARSLSPDEWAAVLEAHDELVDAAVSTHRGAVVKHEGDGTFAAFGRSTDALGAAVAMSAAVVAKAWPAGALIRLRIGLHRGEGRLTKDGADYLGVDVHYAARLAGAGNGGQVLLSDAALRGLDGVLPGGAAIVSAGRRRLKDFEEPLLVHRLVIPGIADDERALRTLDMADLPEILTSFVGRQAELSFVAALVTSSRIVTLTGPGGTGKTRLAVAVASAVRDQFADGIAFVELAPLRDPDLVLAVIAAAAGVVASPDRPIADVLREALAIRRMLVVLDNMEQLLPRAATTLAMLVRDAPHVRLLISSREPLRIAGEQEYPVPPLDAGDAATLFAERAALVRPGYTPDADDDVAIRTLIQRVDGLPLAIELAAARVKLFRPAEILARLGGSLDLLAARSRDVPERQRTLRAAIGWSHDLLTPAEQVQFRRLAVFAADWAPESAATIAADEDIAELDVLDGLASLVDKSLLRTVVSNRGETRFGWHVFVHEFAAEQLTESGERPIIERRHAATFRDIAISAGPHLVEAGAERYLDAIDHAIHDLRQAMAWSLAANEPEFGLQIIGALWRWWQLRLNLREGRDWAARLLAHPAAAGDTAGRVAGLAAAGGLAYWSTDYVATRSAYEERLAIAERLGDRRSLAEAHYDLGFVGQVEKDVALLRREAEQAVRLFEELGDQPGLIRSRQALILAHFLAGDATAALALEEQNLAAFRRTQASYRIADGLMLLAAIHRLAGDPDQARARAREALRAMSERIGGSTIGALGIVAIVEGESGDAQLAARLTGAIQAIQTETGEALAPVAVLHLPDPAEVVRARLGAEAADRLIAEGRRLSPDEAIRLGLGGSEVESAGSGP